MGLVYPKLLCTVHRYWVTDLFLACAHYTVDVVDTVAVWWYFGP